MDNDKQNLILSEKLSLYTNLIIGLTKNVSELKSIMSRIDGADSCESPSDEKIPSNCYMQFNMLNEELGDLNAQLEDIIKRF
jgi:hypothetical protein